MPSVRFVGAGRSFRALSTPFERLMVIKLILPVREVSLHFFVLEPNVNCSLSPFGSTLSGRSLKPARPTTSKCRTAIPVSASLDIARQFGAFHWGSRLASAKRLVEVERASIFTRRNIPCRHYQASPENLRLSKPHFMCTAFFGCHFFLYSFFIAGFSSAASFSSSFDTSGMQ